MLSPTFLIIDEQPISLEQALRHLKVAGKLQDFVLEILRQYAIEQQLKSQVDGNLSSEVIEQAVINFRFEQQLVAPEKFQDWLVSNGIDYTTFHQQIAWRLKLQHIKTQVSQPILQEYFIAHKLFLDMVVLSCITVAEKELASELRSQIEEGARFEQLAQDYSLTKERWVNGRMGPLSRGQMPDGLRAEIDAAQPGDLVGPLDIDGSWYLFQVEEFLPAALEGELKERLQTEIFEQWLTEKVQAMTVQLEVN